MRIGELSAVSGVPLPTVKYYLREGLLPAGERTARNQAEYGSDHITRLRLVRALIEVGGLSVAGTREVLAAADDPQTPLDHMMGAAHDAVTNRSRPTRTEPEWSNARRLVLLLAEQRGWRVEPCAPAIDQAADAIAAVLAMDVPQLLPLLETYAEHAEKLARREVEAVLSMGGPEDVVRGVVVGTILGEAIFNALRLLAQQSVSIQLAEQGEGAPERDREVGAGPLLGRP
jgi:DNA-binding transcriptional MerR regulator